MIQTLPRAEMSGDDCATREGRAYKACDARRGHLPPVIFHEVSDFMFFFNNDFNDVMDESNLADSLAFAPEGFYPVGAVLAEVVKNPVSDIRCNRDGVHSDTSNQRAWVLTQHAWVIVHIFIA
jgi:hypothetical protein